MRDLLNYWRKELIPGRYFLADNLIFYCFNNIFLKNKIELLFMINIISNKYFSAYCKNPI